MPRRLLKAISTPTAKSSAIFYFGNFINSIFRYFFHLVLLRFLVPAQYGEFLSYLSLIYLLSIPMGTITTLITKFVSEFKGKQDDVSINLFFHFIIRKFTLITLIIAALLISFSNPLASIFKADPTAFIVLGVSVLISLYQSVLNSYVIAFQKFIFQTLAGLLGVLLTIILSIGFIRIGLGATGAVIGQILGGLIPSLLIFLSLKPSLYPMAKTKKIVTFSLGSFMGYSFIFALGTMSLISTDVLMVRILFDTHTSGIYSSLSILGRMILFGLLPLVSLVLPIASHRHAATGSAKSILIKLGSVIVLFGLLGAGIFTLFPALIIRILSGSAYLEATAHLPLFAFTMVLFVTCQFILSYLMAIGKPKANLLLLLATLLQPLLIFIFRSSLSAVVAANFGLQLVLLLSLLVTLYFQRT